MGEAVSYRFTSDYLRRQIYAPVRYAQVEQETEQIRQALAKALTAEGLKVLNPVPPEVQEELTRIRQALAKALTADGLKVVTREDQEARTDRPPR